MVERGYHTVTNGPGGSGGAVILERDAPDMAEDKRWEGEFHTGASSNSGSSEVGGAVVLLAGVDNLTDRTYANHLSRANVFDPTLTQVNEPGRSVYIKFAAQV